MVQTIRRTVRSAAALVLAYGASAADVKADDPPCYCDGKYSINKCVDKQRCWFNGSYCVWIDDPKCPS